MEVLAFITKWDLVRFQLWALFHLRVNLIGYALIVAGGITYFAVFTAPENLTDWVIAIAASLIGGICGLMGGLLIILAWTLSTATEKAGILGEHRYAISEAGLQESTTANETFHKWQGIQSFHKTGGNIYIKLYSYLYHIIPRPAFDNEVNFDKFWIQANEYWRRTA